MVGHGSRGECRCCLCTRCVAWPRLRRVGIENAKAVVILRVSMGIVAAAKSMFFKGLLIGAVVVQGVRVHGKERILT